MSQIEEIKDRLDIVDIISETVQLRRSGKHYTGFCPFHHNVRTPAFVVFPETDTWRCFGECSEGGDIYKFIMKKENWDFPEALRYLAERAGVKLKPLTPTQKEEQEEHEALRKLLEEAVTFYRHQLINTSGGKFSLEYLHERDLADKTIEEFELGYAPDSWNACQQHLLSKGYTHELLVESGLVYERDSGGFNDRFRHRIMIPIRDARGRICGFGARALKTDEVAKYINSPQSPIFDKSQLLYGLHKARKTIRKQDQAIIVEGYMGVIALHQANYNNVVAQMGTALTEPQLRQIKRYSRNIILALDSDLAGMNATMRGLQVARETLERTNDPIFDARGLLRNEARLQADIRVSSLPPGMDPDDVVSQDPLAWEEIVTKARPVVEHVMETLIAEYDINDPKAKSDIATQVLPLIQDIPDSIQRYHFQQRLARLLHVDERAIMEFRRPVSRRASRRRSSKSTSQVMASQTPTLTSKINTHLLESHCLGIIMRHPELLYWVNRTLQEEHLERISANDFQHTDHQIMFHASMDALEQEHTEPLNYALEKLPHPLLDEADRILLNTEQLDPNEERVLADLLRTIIQLRQEKLQQINEQIRQMMLESQEQNDIIPKEYLSAINQNRLIKQRLDKALGKI
jgi:DNA primase